MKLEKGRRLCWVSLKKNSRLLLCMDNDNLRVDGRCSFTTSRRPIVEEKGSLVHPTLNATIHRILQSIRRSLPGAHLGVVLICLLSLGCQGGSVSNSPQPKERLPLLVKVRKPERRVLRSTTTQPVTLHAYYQAEIHAKVAGYLPRESFKAEIGQKVQEGEVLGIIDVPEIR